MLRDSGVNGQWGGNPFQDLLNLIKYLEKLPYLDQDKAVLAGASYGGYMVSWFFGHEIINKVSLSISSAHESLSFLSAYHSQVLLRRLARRHLQHPQLLTAERHPRRRRRVWQITLPLEEPRGHGPVESRPPRSAAQLEERAAYYYYSQREGLSVPHH